MGTTPTYGIRYPEPTDKPADIATHFKNLALDVENAIKGVAAVQGAEDPPTGDL